MLKERQRGEEESESSQNKRTAGIPKPQRKPYVVCLPFNKIAAQMDWIIVMAMHLLQLKEYYGTVVVVAMTITKFQILVIV